MRLSHSTKNKYSFHLIKNVYPMNDFLLHVLFYDGIMKKYDIKPMFDSRPYINGKPAFNELRDNVDLYYKATVEEGGHAVI